MKAIIKDLRKQLKALRELIQKREAQFAERSEKWQYSQKGEDFEDATSEIENQAEELEAVIDNLEDLN